MAQPVLSQSFETVRDSSYSLNSKGKSRDAIRLLESNMEAFDSGSDEFAYLSNDLGLLYLGMGRFNEAGKQFHKFIDHFPGNGYGKSNLSLVMIELADYDSAESLLNTALKEIRDQHRNPEFLNALNNLAIVHFKKGNIKQAERIYKTSMGPLISVSGGKTVDFANWLNNLALLYIEISRYEDALEFLERALKVYQATAGEKSMSVGIAYNNLGKVYSILGAYDTADEYFNKSRRIIRKKSHQYGILLNNLGNSNYDQGRWKKADQYFSQSLEANKELYGEDHPVNAQSLKSMARLNISLNDLKQAERLINEALTIEQNFFNPDHPRIIESRLLLVEVLSQLKDYDGAARSLNEIESNLKGSQTSTVSKMRFLRSRGFLYASMGDYDNAFAQYELAYETGRDKGMRENLSSIELKRLMVGMKMKAGRFEQASELSADLLATMEDLFELDHPVCGEILIQNAKIQAALEDPRAAVAAYQKGLSNYLKQVNSYFPFLVEEEKLKFYSLIRDHFESYYSLAIENFPDDSEINGSILNYQMAIKALVLNATTLWKSSIRNSGDINLIKKFSDWQLKNEQLSEWIHLDKTEQSERGINVAKLQDEVYEIEKDLLLKAGRFTKTRNVQSDWKDVKGDLDETTALIDLVRFRSYNFASLEFGDQVNYAGIILRGDSDSPDLVRLENGSELENRHIKAYRNSIKFKSADKVSYQAFWEPLKNEVEDMSTIFVALDGVYNQINLNSLLNPETGEYLIDELDVHIVSNIKSIPGEEVEINNQFALLIGNPDFNFTSTEMPSEEITRAEIQPLPGTAEEIDNLQLLLEDYDWEVTVLTETEATEVNLREAFKPGLLHIATHGFFNDKSDQKLINPLMLSGLMLSGASYSFASLNEEINAEKPDGLLTAAEAMTLNVDNTDLVVLSACETGLGEIKNGDGVYGLQRSFLNAGANSLMMTLWKIDDQATQELMKLFYERWINGESKYEAFKAAQIELREMHPEPYYWAAFTLVE